MIKMIALAKWMLGPNALIVAGAVGVWVEGGIIGVAMAHPVIFTAGVIYVLYAAITAMRNPWDGWYNWFYRFSHALLPLAEQALNYLRPGLAQVPEQSDQPQHLHPQPLPSSATVSTEVRLGGSPPPSQT